MVQTSFGFNGRFWPISRPLFHGAFAKPISDGIAVGMFASLVPTAPAAAQGHPLTRGVMTSERLSNQHKADLGLSCGVMRVLLNRPSLSERKVGS